jgi:enhancer of yellow 2 transcription factor
MFYFFSSLITDFHCVKVETARAMEPLLFSILFSEISPRIQSESFVNPRPSYLNLSAVASMPLAVKRELSNLIRQHVEKQFE